MPIKVYKREESLGLANQITAASKIVVAASVLPKTEKSPLSLAVELYGEEYAKNAAKYLPQDIALVHSILVTTNWNKNDDVFTPDETWAARHTPTLKPANIDHVGREGVGNQIIGVITAARPVDEKYNPVYGEYDKDGNEKIPGHFNILCTTALWQAYFPEAVGTILNRIDENKQFVSMECIFNDFGYALREHSTSELNLLPRNEITAWLTANLRAYGGKGTVVINGKNYTIGRWLRSITFSGVGYVQSPANDESIVFQDYIANAAHKNDKYITISDADSLNWGESKQNFDKNVESCVWNNSTIGSIQLWA